MKGSTAEPQIVSESDVKMVGPGYDDDHYIPVPIKPFFELDGVGDEIGHPSCVLAQCPSRGRYVKSHRGPAAGRLSESACQQCRTSEALQQVL